MTKEEFIEKYYCCYTIEDGIKCNKTCADCKKACEQDLDSVIKDSWPKTVCEYNSYQHVLKCPKCNGWIFFNDESIKDKSVGGMTTARLVHCDACKDDVPMYPWRCL